MTTPLEPLPCPFCASDPWSEMGLHGTTLYVMCRSCNIITHSIPVKDWNRRAAETALQAARNAMREECVRAIERVCEEIAHENGYTEPDTGAYVTNDDTTARLETFDDAIAIVRAIKP